MEWRIVIDDPYDQSGDYGKYYFMLRKKNISWNRYDNQIIPIKSKSSANGNPDTNSIQMPID